MPAVRVVHASLTKHLAINLHGDDIIVHLLYTGTNR